MRISDWSSYVCSSDLVPPAPCMLAKLQFEALSEFRFRLAQFLHFSESAARAEGVTPAQYLLLLHLHGFNGRSWGTVGELAERLQASHQATVALVQRCERNGLVAKRRSRSDARYVENRKSTRLNSSH